MALKIGSERREWRAPILLERDCSCFERRNQARQDGCRPSRPSSPVVPIRPAAPDPRTLRPPHVACHAHPPHLDPADAGGAGGQRQHRRGPDQRLHVSARGDQGAAAGGTHALHAAGLLADDSRGGHPLALERPSADPAHERAFDRHLPDGVRGGARPTHAHRRRGLGAARGGRLGACARDVSLLAAGAPAHAHAGDGLLGRPRRDGGEGGALWRRGFAVDRARRVAVAGRALLVHLLGAVRGVAPARKGDAPARRGGDMSTTCPRLVRHPSRRRRTRRAR